jgi:plasmid replication initiation protein
MGSGRVLEVGPIPFFSNLKNFLQNLKKIMQKISLDVTSLFPNKYDKWWTMYFMYYVWNTINPS